jgi:hypothetical protein
VIILLSVPLLLLLLVILGLGRPLVPEPASEPARSRPPPLTWWWFLAIEPFPTGAAGEGGVDEYGDDMACYRRVMSNRIWDRGNGDAEFARTTR